MSVTPTDNALIVALDFEGVLDLLQIVTVVNCANCRS
jgi:hypothetical protein